MGSDSDSARDDRGSSNKPDFVNLLPGNDSTWTSCTLGQPSKWPKALQAFALTIASFSYPAAIFWGEQFVVLHNITWHNAGGADEQGQAQRGKLRADVYDCLSATLHGGKPRKLSSRQILGEERYSGKSYTVLLSPLFDHEDNDEAAGVLAQLMPEPIPSECDDGAMSPVPKSNPATQDSADLSELGDVAADIPLDEHPFFHRFAEMLPTGLAILDHKARAIFVNQNFYELTTHQGDDQSFKSWPQSIHPEDYERVMNAYQEAFRSQTQLRTEFRSLGQRYPWRLLLLTPLGDENLKHVSLRSYGGFICSIVDISSEKRAELDERKAAKEAQERKEQQERFIDMISHEIRNPLSAILHCTEDIEEAMQPKTGTADVESIQESVETINLCVSHQRNIVDDVLSFSKLDSSMLSLAPKPCEPSRQLANSLKMFEPEFRKQGMKFGYSIDGSYSENAVAWVMADLARVGQILVNLVTNAIKFTVRSEGRREIDVSVGASIERPTSWPPSVVFFNADDLAYRMDGTNTSEWGNGETLFIMVAVKDTGIGISEEGQKRLFERFRQATPKTGEVYGGSGLGLNISRKLCHLHGGEIGVASKEGEGSTFGFFFKTKRARIPAGDSSQTMKEQEEEDDVKEQIDQHGLASPDEIDRSLVPQSLEDRPVTRTKLFEKSDVEGDGKYQRTANIASKIQEPESDPYANSERPKVSHQHRSGEFWQSKDVTDRNLDQRMAGGSAATTSQEHRPHVLLAEDNVINQRILFRKLEKHGFNVTTANNGREAVDGIRNASNLSSGEKSAFDLVLMDQEMPVMDGNAATVEIRELEKDGNLQHTPILGVTANVREDQQDEMLASGMDDIITKPYKIEELVAKMKKLLGNVDGT